MTNGTSTWTPDLAPAQAAERVESRIQRWSAWMDGPWAALLVGIIAVGAFAWVASRSTLWDRDESRFAEASSEVLLNHDWLVPTFAGNLRPHKPILLYWMMAPSIVVF